jgi:multidrug efflux pump subunit AcrA (membrane-fusion protein)
MRHLRVLLWIPALYGIIHVCASCGANSSSERNANPQAVAPTTPSVEVVSVSSKKLAITVRLPGELQPYEVVAVFPKVTGFVESIRVDRGSVVRAGQMMIRLVAP